MNIGSQDEISSSDGRGTTEVEEDTPLLSGMDDFDKKRSIEILVSNTSGRKFPQYLATICSTLGAFALGTTLAWTSPVYTTNDNYINKVMKDFTEDEIRKAWSWIGALMPLGGAIISVFIGYLIGKFGRKGTMLSLVIPFTIGWLLIILPNGIWMVYVGRLILGMAGGAFAVAAPVYTAEISEKDIRGALGSYFQLMTTLGVLFVYVIGDLMSGRNLSIVCAVIPLIFGVVFFFMPESPEYLLMKDQDAAARKSLQFFRGKDYNIDAELEDMKKNVENTRSQQRPLMSSFNTRAAKVSMFISLGLMFVQQLSGINAVIFYTNDIFKVVNAEANPSTSSIIVGSVQVVSTFVSTLVVDRLGRKVLLLISSTVMSLCTLLLGVFFILKDDGKDVAFISWIPLVSLCFFMISFSIGFGPIPWMILGELFPPSIKGTASSIASTFNWILAFLVTKFYGPISKEAGTGVTFFIFMSVLIIGTIFVWRFVRETKGKSPEEIQSSIG